MIEIEWGVVITVLVAAITASGAWVTAKVTAKSKASDERHQLIDQLQEERDAKDRQLREERATFVEQLREERAAADKRSERQNAHLDRLWTDKAMSREYVAALRAQIWAGGEPPPVDPPEGYIE